MSEHTLSSTAYRAYWLGRYLERAGNTARLVSVNANLVIDLPLRTPLAWTGLIEILAMQETFDELQSNDLEAFARTRGRRASTKSSTGKSGSKSAARDNSETKPTSPNYEKEVTRFLLSDTRHGGSIMSALLLARENARALRGALPRATYEYVNEAYLYAKDAFAEPLSRTRRANGLTHLLERLQQIDGFLSSTMLHLATWQFIRLGNYTERADMITRLIDLPTTDLIEPTSDLAPFRDIQWRSVLSSVDAMQSYTVTVQKPVAQPDVLEFLFKNPDLPRSLLRCLNTIRNCLKSLPKNREPMAQINTMRRQLQRARVQNLEGEKLRRFVDARQKHLNILHGHIANTYFPGQ